MLSADKLKLTGRIHLEQYRDGKLINKIDITNAVTTAGKNALFDSFFRNQTQPASWFFGLIDNAGYTAVNVNDTMSNHTGWAEHQAYDEATRQTWVTVAAANGQINNTTAATFTINATGSVRGAFITSSNTKGGTTGTLWSTGLFTSALAVVDNDQLKLTYTVGA